MTCQHMFRIRKRYVVLMAFLLCCGWNCNSSSPFFEVTFQPHLWLPAETNSLQGMWNTCAERKEKVCTTYPRIVLLCYRQQTSKHLPETYLFVHFKIFLFQASFCSLMRSTHVRSGFFIYQSFENKAQDIQIGSDLISLSHSAKMLR